MFGQHEIIIVLLVVLMLMYYFNFKKANAAEGLAVAGRKTNTVFNKLKRAQDNALNKIKNMTGMTGETFITPAQINRAYAVKIPGTRTRVTSQFAV